MNSQKSFAMKKKVSILKKRVSPSLLGSLGLCLFLAAAVGSSLALSPQAQAQSTNSLIERVQKNTETEIRRLIEPLLSKYCQDSCKLLSVSSQVDLKIPEELAPGFDDLQRGPASTQTTSADLAPTSARVKLLIDDKVGPVSRQNILDLIDQFLTTLNYPVKVDSQVTHFPQPIGTESHLAELREKVAKDFRNTLDQLFSQFCPEQCLLSDFNLETKAVNPEEAQYGKSGEFLQEGDVALKIQDLSGTILIDDRLPPEERNNVLEMAKLKTSRFQNVSLALKALKFPRPDDMLHASGLPVASRAVLGQTDALGNSKELNRSLASTTDSKESHSTQSQTSQTTENQQSLQQDSKVSSQSSENSKREDRIEHYEKIERVESGSAVQAELKRFGVYGLVLACVMLSILVFVAMASLKPKATLLGAQASGPSPGGPNGGVSAPSASGTLGEDQRKKVALRYECERLTEELSSIFAEHPKVAKQVFSRVLTEEGVETTSQYIQVFGEGVVVDMLRDPSLQSDLSELMEFYAKNPQEMKDDEKLELLRKLQNRTVAGKLFVMGNRSSNLFDFLAEMDGLQILELVRNESLTVKSIILTQVDPSKRQAIYAQLDEETRMKLLNELSRIDYLPRDYIFNVANALKRKRKDNPRLNTEALPGSEVLVSLLEKTGVQIQRSVVKNLELSSPEAARVVKAKLVSLDTLRFLRDGQLLEVVLSLKHEELLSFLKGAPGEIKQAIFSKSPKELIVELEEELEALATQTLSRETYLSIERKVLNRMKLMANEGLVNLVETNERMFASESTDPALATLAQTYPGGVLAGPNDPTQLTSTTTANIKKVAGW